MSDYTNQKEFLAFYSKDHEEQKESMISAHNEIIEDMRRQHKEEFENVKRDQQTALENLIAQHEGFFIPLKECELKREPYSLEDSYSPEKAGKEECFGRAYNDDDCRDEFTEIPRVWESSTLVCPDVEACESNGNYGECVDFGYSGDEDIGRRYDDDHGRQGIVTNSEGHQSHKCPRTIPCKREVYDYIPDPTVDHRNVSVTLKDSYGDGFNGVKILVPTSENKTKLTLDSGSEGTQDILLECGREHTFQCSESGGYHSEVSFAVLGNTYFDGGCSPGQKVNIFIPCENPMHVDSCKGYSCEGHEGKYCPPGAPGSSEIGYCCVNNEWVERSEDACLNPVVEAVEEEPIVEAEPVEDPMTEEPVALNVGWQCVLNIDTPLRRNPETGDIECASTDNKNCLWTGGDMDACRSSIENAKNNASTAFSCGQEHQEVYGDTGYDNPEHWCTRGKGEIEKFEQQAVIVLNLCGDNSVCREGLQCMIESFPATTRPTDSEVQEKCGAQTIPFVACINSIMQGKYENMAECVAGSSASPEVASPEEPVALDVGWQCVLDIDTPLRRNPETGEIECASTNNRDCLWAGNMDACRASIENAENNAATALSCGQEHADLYEDTGYDNPAHWCARGKIAIEDLELQLAAGPGAQLEIVQLSQRRRRRR